MQESLRLLHDRIDNARVAVAGGVHGDAGAEVEEDVAVLILNAHSETAHWCKRVGAGQASGDDRLVGGYLSKRLWAWHLGDQVRQRGWPGCRLLGDRHGAPPMNALYAECIRGKPPFSGRLSGSARAGTAARSRGRRPTCQSCPTSSSRRTAGPLAKRQSSHPRGGSRRSRRHRWCRGRS